MGIRFACNHCGHVLNVKSDLAGKRGICPKCQARVDIPLESTVARHSHGSSPSPLKVGASATPASTTPNPVLPAAAREESEAGGVPLAAPLPTPVAVPVAVPGVADAGPTISDPIAEAPHLLWYVAPAGSTNPYGPASGDMFRAWIQEGRVAADSMVWRQDWGTWLPAGEVLPQLARSEPVISVVPTETSGPGAIITGPIIPGAIGSGSTASGPVIVGPIAGASPVGVRGAGWSPAAAAPGNQPAVVGVREARGRKASPFNTINVIIVLGILVVVLLPVMWYVLRH